jgi:CRISPR system Cascade subunit CasA
MTSRDRRFNLIDEPWIPCLMADGTPREFGLAEVFDRARAVREIFDESPLVTVSLHRLLLAILHRNFGPAGEKEWLELWRGRRNPEVLGAYLSRWRERFNLFDAKRPFFQVPEIEDAGLQPVSTLFQQFATGNNTTLFDHSFEDRPACLSFAAAARGVVARQAFSVGFGKSSPFYFSDSPLIRGYTVLVSGGNLFETLLLNLIRYDDESPIPKQGNRQDLPVWEQDKPAAPKKDGTVPAGYLDYLTWQSRRIHLLAEPDGSGVRWCQLQQNLKLSDNAGAVDPFKCYRKDEKRGWVPLSFREEKALWRDSDTLLQSLARSHSRTAILEWLAAVAGSGAEISVPRVPNLAAFGLATDIGKAASVTLWRHERMPLPLVLLSDEALIEKLSQAISYAEQTGRDLRAAAWTLARTLLEPPVEGAAGQHPRARKEDVEPLARSFGVERCYWPTLDAPFLNFIVQFADAARDSRDDELARWRKLIRTGAREAFAAATRDLDLTARQLRAVAIAERSLLRRLREGTQEGEEL